MAPTGTAPASRIRTPVLGFVPFLLFVSLFLLVPIAVTLVRAFTDAEGGFTLEHLVKLAEPEYARAFENSTKLSLLTSVGGGAGGLLLAWALTGLRGGAVHRFLLSLSGVAAQMGGAPLAFAFIATIGAQGLVTGWLADGFGVQLNEMLPINSFVGIVAAYLYFQIPMMTILMLPAIEGLRQEWMQGAESLGAGPIRRFLDISLPILAPSLAGSLILLFANAFSGYAAAYAMAGSGANLVPVLIGYFLGGNVRTDQGLAAALVTGMILVMVAIMLVRSLLLRRVTRWTR